MGLYPHASRSKVVKIYQTLNTLLIAMNANTRNTEYAWDFMKVLTCNTQIQSERF